MLVAKCKQEEGSPLRQLSAKHTNSQ